MVCLIVDDDASIRAVVRSILRSEGHEILEADGGCRALDTLGRLEGSVDLIITDIQMPEGDGVTLARQVTRLFPRIRVILMSGYGEYPEESDFVAKPFSWETMLTVVRRVVARPARAA
jgi:two-component system cell cycle sensor histidine kinase/response regulator CckA